jgi:aryl-alcohol dehydrogenase (NADP+)
MIPACIDQGIGLIPWSPIARGFLGRKREHVKDTIRAQTDLYAQQMYYREEDFDVAERAQEIAEARGVTPSQIALAWVLNKPYITAPIIGASKMDHLEQAIAALEIQLSPEEITRLEEPYRPHPILGHE